MVRNEQQGSMTVGKKYLGKLDRALLKYVDEQLEGRTQPCPQSDVYSWGRLMQEMLSGIDMSRDDSCYEQAAAIYDGEISYGLAKIIRKCTYEQKEKRYAGAAEVIAALDGKKHLNESHRHMISV